MADIIQFHEESHKMDSENIRRSNYTNSLIAEAARVGILTPDEVLTVQAAVMDALEEAIRLYTKGESTSVMTETAQNLLSSVIVCLDEYLVSLNSHERALETITTQKVPELYLLGYRQLKTLLFEAISLMVKVKKTKLDINNNKYEQTIEQHIPAFLKAYDAHFDGVYTISHFYPLAVPLPKTGGVIRSLILYLNSLIEENAFCAKIPGTKILYNEYKEQHLHQPVFPGDNFYAITLHNAVFAILAGRKPGSLRVDAVDCHHLSQTMGTLSSEAIATQLAEAAVVLENGSSHYAMNTLKHTLPQITHALYCDSLHKMLVTY